MNVGGPAYHVSVLSGRLAPERYDTLLVTGNIGPSEASFEDLARRYGARLSRVATLGPELSPLRDLRALGALVRIVRRYRPDIVHTHTAKAGTLGRLAALLAGRPRPVIVHTFHGHVLTGYFGPAKNRVFRAIERWLGRRSDRLIGVSEATVAELVALEVAERERFSVVRLGLELDRFLAVAPARCSGGQVTALFVGRLVPIKRLDVLLAALAEARRLGADVRLEIAGDGELRAELEALAERLSIATHVGFLGFRADLDRLVAAADIAVLSSDNEGTPVALIEAAAGARPAVATDAGGVCEIVTPETGRTVAAGDSDAFAQALVELAQDPELRQQLGAAARRHVRERYAIGRLLRDVDALYQELLAEAA